MAGNARQAADRLGRAHDGESRPGGRSGAAAESAAGAP
jgi:hypothetical protein